MAIQSWNSTAFRIIDADVGEEYTMFNAGSTLFGNPGLTGVINMYFVGDFQITGGTLYGEGCGAPVFSVACQGEAGVVINAGGEERPETLPAASRARTVYEYNVDACAVRSPALVWVSTLIRNRPLRKMS